MDKKVKDNIFQILILVMLVVIAFYLGSIAKNTSGGGSKIAKNDQNVADQGEEIAIEEISYDQLASDIGLNAEDFTSCIDSEEAVTEVQRQLQSGVDAGIQGTPGVILYDKQTKTGVQVAGAVPMDMLKNDYTTLKSGKGTAMTLEEISDKDYVRGNANARYIMFEWSDFDCPFCVRFYPTANQFVEEFKDEVAYVYRQYPIEGLHPGTTRQSQSAFCAGKLGGSDTFWKAVDILAK